jgi:hypothetical protein
VIRPSPKSKKQQSHRLSLWGLHWTLCERVTMIKPGSNGVKGTGKLANDDTLALKELPALRGFFLDQCYTGTTTERLPGVMIVKACGDGWSWTLKDPTSCVMMRMLSRTWDEGLMLLEAALWTEDAPWEADPYEAARRGKKRGKA